MKPRHCYLAASLLLWQGVAAAQSAAPPASSEALLTRGVEARKAGDDRAAFEAFRRAFELDGSGRALAQMALAEQALGRWVDAYEHLQAALAREGDAWVNEHRAALAGALGEIEGRLGSLDIACNVAGASVEVDGQARGQLPLAGPLRLSAGQSVVTVSAPGYFKIVRQVQVDAGELSRLEIALTPNTGTPAGLPARAVPQAPSHSASRDVLMYGSIGLAAVGLTAGVTGYVMREVNVRAYNDDARCYRDPDVPRSTACPDEAAAYRRGQVIAIVGFSGAAVFGGLGLYLWLERPKQAASTAAACAFQPLGVTCAGRF